MPDSIKAKLGDFLCVDCGIHTSDVDEYYMVHSEIWREFVPENRYSNTMLCIGCLEKRMGHKLTPKDFKDCPLNNDENSSKSNRLLNRMGLKKVKKSKKTGMDIYRELMGGDPYFIKVEPIIDSRMRGLCTRAYPNHPKGCPNFHKKPGCPPECPRINELIMTYNPMPVYAIFNRFDFKGHCDRMRANHPEWSQRQVECCLYWQGTARKVLKDKIEAFSWKFPHWGMGIVTCPEGAGVNLTETMKNVGIELEWPPVNCTYQIVLAGIPKERK